MGEVFPLREGCGVDLEDCISKKKVEGQDGCSTLFSKWASSSAVMKLGM